jgi:hypothetical protein
VRERPRYVVEAVLEDIDADASDALALHESGVGARQ